MRKIILACFFLGIFSSISAQNWSDDVADIFYNKCTSCHHTGGIAPFSLMTYQEASSWRNQILLEVMNDRMPPWTADTNYQEYSHSRYLSSAEKTAIIDWANMGVPSGDLNQAPAPPVYTPGRTIAKQPDLVVKMPVYKSKASPTADDYSCFVIPTGLNSTKRIKAIEVVPGNPEIVHHCLVYKQNAGVSQTDTSGFCGGPTSSSAQLMAGYTPGATPTVYPGGGGVNLGITITPNDELLLAMHYPLGSAGEIDSTQVNIYYYPDSVTSIRDIFAAPILENWGFCIDSNEVDTVSDVYPTNGGVPADFTMLSVFPHMHLIGQSIEAYGVKPNNDTIPFIKIPQWDFDWQDFYYFKNPIKVPMGSKLAGSAVYNNVAGAGHHFPNPDPVQVCAGFNTSDEMFLIYFHFLPYQLGDELMNVDSLNQIWFDEMAQYASVDEQETEGFNLSIFPNPTNGKTTISIKLIENSEVSAAIYDSKGRKVSDINKGNLSVGRHLLLWDGTFNNGKRVDQGVYYLSMLVNGKPTSKRIIMAY